MFLIGRIFFRLKQMGRGLGFLVFLIIVSYASWGDALDRILSDAEVNKLEANIAADPKNQSSVRFLMHHYYQKKQWPQLIKVGQGRQKDLEAHLALLLVEAYIQSQDGPSALTVIGQIHGQVGVTSNTKVLEALALAVTGEKEKTDIEKMNFANKAIQTIREAAELDPKNRRAYLSWVEILRNFWPSFAQDALNVVRVMEQKTGDFESNMGLKCELYTKAALWDQGAVVCQRALKANPKDVMARYYLAEVQAVKVGPAERKKILEQLGQQNPNHYTVQKALADLYYTEKNYVAATAKYRLVAALEPNDLSSILRLAQSEFQIKQYLPALEAYKKHCKNSRMVASEFKDATKQLRSDKNLHKFYDDAMQSCR